MPDEEQRFQIHLEGLIQILAQNLYSDPDIFLREMIQNAHDSISRRTVLAAGRGDAELPPPVIRVAADRTARTIEITDNGSGLTRREIDEYLSTIGRSGNTEELRHLIREADRSRTIELIGQFGIGLLSAFIVADKVSLVTKAAGHQALRWESRGGEGYRVEPAERDKVGTTVTLHLDTKHDYYLDNERLRSIIRTYADFLGMPVYLNDEAGPANAVNAPWHRAYPSAGERDSAHREFWVKKFRHENPLLVLAIDEGFDWEDGTVPGGRGHGRVRGVLAVTGQHVPDLSARGTVDVFIKRMFIVAGNPDVLPPWAAFLQGVLECDELTPNAARDNVVRNAALTAAQEALGRLIVRELTELSHQDHERFLKIMRWHSYHLLAMSVHDEHEEFFRAVADMMPLDSDQGPITVPEYLATAVARADGSRLVYYITERGSANQFFLLAGARGIRVFNCAEPFAEHFLKRYEQAWPEKVRLDRLDVASSEIIFEPIEADARETYRDLEAAYTGMFSELRCTAEVSRFRPVEVPAVLTQTRDRRNRDDLEAVARNPAMPGFIQDLLKDFLAEEREPLTLHLNADNPTIQKLAVRSGLRDEVSRQTLMSLYYNALMLLARALRPEDVHDIFAQHNQVIELVMSLDEQRADFENALKAQQMAGDELPDARGPGGLDPYVSCFVAMPFGDDRAREIYQAVRTVAEDHPYYWRVVRADDTVEEPGLWENLKAKLHRAHCFVAIITGELNPNVMIEIGRMEALQRPLLILRDANSPRLPADLNGLLYEDLRRTGGDLAGEIRDVLSRHDLLRGLHAVRYLSEAVLKRHVGLDGEIARLIIRDYPTWESFLVADPQEVARQTDVKIQIIRAAQASLRDADSA